jgi:hypothetical protein
MVLNAGWGKDGYWFMTIGLSCCGTMLYALCFNIIIRLSNYAKRTIWIVMQWAGWGTHSALFCMLTDLKRCAHNVQTVHARLKPNRCTDY